MAGSFPTGSHTTGGALTTSSAVSAQTYPLVALEFKIVPVMPKMVNVGSGIRSMDISNAEVYQIDIVHPLLDSDDRDTLVAFYLANRTTVNTLDLAGDRYDVRYMADYAVKHISATRFTLTTTMMGVR